ncbi:MAG: DNA polymerase III subunit delta [Phycisphaerae bacterium]|nr:DNA polymerase III subunit delta [Phycisphaerae bacterium]NUQ46490.1 DNA polymerase III subunit delta [Phycisphaerae bacterium]
MAARSTSSRSSRTAAPTPVAGDPPVHLVTGTDLFIRREVLAALTRKILGDDPPDGLALAEFDGEEAELAAVLDEVRTPGLLAPRRLVRVDNSDEFLTKYRQKVEEYLEHPTEGGVLVLICDRKQTSSRLYKLLKPIDGVHECETPKPQALPGWVVERARTAYDRGIDAQAARLLVDQAGDTLDRLDSELAKLAVFVGDRSTITTADVEEAVGAHREKAVFGVMDAINERNPARALQLWDQVLAGSKTAEFGAVGGLAFVVRQLIDAKRFALTGGRHGAVSKWQRSTRFSLIQLEEMLALLVKMDSAAKSSGGETRLGVEKFIVTYATR